MSEFNAKKVKDDLIQWLKDWEKENAAGCNFIVGISGGKDSTIVAALLKECFGADRVYGVLMPLGYSPDIHVARDVVKTLGIHSIEFDLYGIVSQMKIKADIAICDNSHDNRYLHFSDKANTNLPCRVRMTFLYAIAQSLNGRVIGTCNLSENYIGYFTRYGDGASDCEPLANLTVTEVKYIGYELGLSDKFIEKIPDDGLPNSMPDEEKFGFTYDILDKYIRTGEIENDDAKQKIDAMHDHNLFKLNSVPTFKYKEI